MAEPSFSERVVGCLLGGACGDALGAPLEFLDDQAISQLSSRTIAEMLPAYKRKGGAITDDTQMTLFSVEALIEIAGDGSPDDAEQLDFVAAAYLRWYETQTRRRRRSDSGLLAHKELFSQRAPGHTCMTALRKLAYDGNLQADNSSKGCGTVMRAAPFGLVDRVDLAGTASDLTHGHPTARASSVALAEIIRHLVNGMTMSAAVDAALDYVDQPSSPGHREVVESLQIAIRLAADGPPSQQVIESLGGGWVAEESLAIAVLCALTGQAWEDTLIRAVSHEETVTPRER